MNDIGTYCTIILNNSKFNIYGQLRKVFTSNLLFYVSTFRKLAKHMTIKHKLSIHLYIYVFFKTSKYLKNKCASPAAGKVADLRDTNRSSPKQELHR